MQNFQDRDIRNFLDDLKNESWITVRSWWPDYLFHTSPLDNAINILCSKTLLSRLEAKECGGLKSDVADDEVISGTNEEWKKYVRMYMRPKTPTLYASEGVRQLGLIKHNAHCPVPIVFMLDAEKILSMKETKFSNGNLGASGVEVSDDFDDFKNLPFKKIYHSSSFSPVERANILFHRHAEVIVEKSLPLENILKQICCRSNPEKRTLLYLLPPNIRQGLQNIIRVSNASSLFYENWLFLKKLEHDDDKIIMIFNENTEKFGPFDVRFVEETESGKIIRDKTITNKILTTKARIKRKDSKGKTIIFTLYIDGNLIFKDKLYSFPDIPF